MADSPRPPADDWCPYVGLQPFTVRDHDYFFGREKEQRVISANLFAAPLTILYGPSAVGKSSVLQAGVASHLASEPRTAVIYFASWQGDDYLPRLKAECRRGLAAVHNGQLDIDDRLPLDEWIARALAQFRGALLLMLDQFEEYLLYHREDDPRALDAELARIVNRQDVTAHVLIGLREDSLSKLNRFSKRIPNLLGNTLQLRRLSPEAARRAVIGPIERYVAQHPGARPTRIDEPLVGRIIADVQIENVAATVSGGIGGVHASEDRGLIETAFLQLVLTELWRAASDKPGDRVLNAETLDALGGAKAIVRRHVDREVGKLTDVGREIAAKLFLHLVTPSGAKYALRTEDLVELAGRPRDQVTAVLSSLAQARLLRRLDPPERYEIFHDAFAVALLEWRKGYLQAQAQQEALRVAEERRRVELAELSRRRRMQLLFGGVIVLLLAGGVYFWHEQRDKAELAANLEIAKTAAQKSAEATEAALKAQKQAEAEKLAANSALEAGRLELRARLEGNAATATRLRAEQADKERIAAAAHAEADRYQREAAAKLADANRSQARLNDLVKDAGSKGYTISNIGETNAPPSAPVVAPPSPEPPKAAPPTVEAKPAPVDATTPATTPASVDYRDAYRKAIAAKDRKQWKNAQTQLESALRGNARDTGETINISGFGNVEPYLPHFQLGIVLSAQSDCAAAVKQFDQSEQDEAIKKTRLYKTLLQQREACAGRK